MINPLKVLLNIFGDKFLYSYNNNESRKPSFCINCGNSNITDEQTHCTRCGRKI